MNNLFTLSIAEQPATHEWAGVAPERQVYAPDWLEHQRTLDAYADSYTERVFNLISMFDPIDDLAPPPPFDPRRHGKGPDVPFLDGSGRFVCAFEPVTGWRYEGDGIAVWDGPTLTAA